MPFHRAEVFKMIVRHSHLYIPISKANTVATTATTGRVPPTSLHPSHITNTNKPSLQNLPQSHLSISIAVPTYTHLTNRSEARTHPPQYPTITPHPPCTNHHAQTITPPKRPTSHRSHRSHLTLSTNRPWHRGGRFNGCTSRRHDSRTVAGKPNEKKLTMKGPRRRRCIDPNKLDGSAWTAPRIQHERSDRFICIGEGE